MSTSHEDATAQRVRSAVAERYSLIGTNPTAENSIPRGRAWAEKLGYPADMLTDIPDSAVDAFTGIGAPILEAQLEPGDVVLDLGCGAGMDTLLIARQVGARGHVFAVDLADGMVIAAQSAVASAHVENVSVMQGPAEAIPLGDNSVDVAVVNGLFNLAPDKDAVASELMRVVRPGGRFVGAEIVLTHDQLPTVHDLEAWFR